MGNNLKLNFKIKCHQPKQREVNSERSAEREEPRDSPPRPSRTPSSVSPSQPSEDSPEEVVSRESALSSMTRPELFSEASSRTLSETQSPTLNTPRERPSPPSMSSMLS